MHHRKYQQQHQLQYQKIVLAVLVLKVYSLKSGVVITYQSGLSAEEQVPEKVDAATLFARIEVSVVVTVSISAVSQVGLTTGMSSHCRTLQKNP